MAEKGRVCVTGAGGYVGSWLVKLLLSRGYRVHGTLREPGDVKNAHLKKLDDSLGNLRLFKADLLDYSSLHTAIAGCDGVFHVASPVPPGMVLNPENYYRLSKTVAESEAWDYAKRSELNVVTVCPSLVIGPMLQSTLNASSWTLFRLLQDGSKSVENKVQMIVDVRDVAEALLLVYEKLEAEGRYICTAHMSKTMDLVDKLRRLYPNYSYPKNFTEVDEGAKLSSEKLQRLGWKYRPLEETLVDSVKSYQESGLLD
ncbi:cinnamoyl-CoA reductase 1-like isoform X3 [Macadamia integrifolia]|uniref:cinnamoyl-CoA reductase 1-like isoform X3 n=1 Tax=Macadamia integrifolia TaxID=60698 RepID=UPI001C4EB1EC|nr:cinnamoyl-CoA reductase 1-like isoform X3 [Macadamia integrifolia]